jgi:hypothetical protein
LLELKRNGMTYVQIAKRYGVTENAVYLALLKVPGGTKPRPRYDEFIPWRVKSEHLHAVPATMLRCLAREAAGETLPQRRKTTLEGWLKRVREADVVVDYDPDQPPNPASPKHGGFRYVKRRPEDGTGFIRRPTT